MGASSSLPFVGCFASGFVALIVDGSRVGIALSDVLPALVFLCGGFSAGALSKGFITSSLNLFDCSLDDFFISTAKVFNEVVSAFY